MASQIEADEDEDEERVLQWNYKCLREFPKELMIKKSFRRVEKIYLKTNLLEALPLGLGTVLPALSELYVQCNNLSSLPKDLGDLKLLTVLDVSGNCLTELTPSVAKLKCLRKLQISSNCISSLPKEIGFLQKLTVLEATRNYLSYLPLELMNCGSLKTLALDCNQVLEVPRQLCNLESLEELSLSGNKLLTLPQGLGHMRCLKAVYVDNNPCLSCLPVSLQCHPNLGYRRCGLEEIPEERLDFSRYITRMTKHGGSVGNVRVVLPSQLSCVMSTTNPVPSLLELCLREAYRRHYEPVTINQLPVTIATILQNIPTGYCMECSRAVFVSAFPVTLETEATNLLWLGFCCSVQCLSFCMRTRNVLT